MDVDMIETTPKPHQVNITENPLDAQVQENDVDETSANESRKQSKIKQSLRTARQSIRNHAKRTFKVDDDIETQQLWDDRKTRLLTRTCGKLKSVDDSDRTDKKRDIADIGSTQCYRDPAWKVALHGLTKTFHSVERKFSKRDHVIEDQDVVPSSLPNDEDVTDGIPGTAQEILTVLRPKPHIKGIFDDHRPFFTWFMVTCHVLLVIASLMRYGFGPVGLFSTTKTSKVLVPSLSLQQVDYKEAPNLWLGIPAGALIHLGAKYAPCMRYDQHIFDHLSREQEEERNTGCCVRNDESGCVQTVKERCSDRVSTWKKWTPDKPGPTYRHYVDSDRFEIRNRTSGPVCGQDPQFCALPASVPPNDWNDDITMWPICREPMRPRLSEPHVSCEIIGRPCCFGIHGQCQITTQEFCQFVDGYFHEEATLCSQVSCMNDVCGLLPFDKIPNQFYRVMTSLFMHAGIVHLSMTLVFYYFYMDPIESYLGPARTSVIFLLSGCGGNLLSASFVPYRAEVGPSGSIMGMMACLLVIIWSEWNQLESAKRQLCNKLSVTAFFFICGFFLPWIDNYAHLGGFIVGFFLSIALVPYVAPYPTKYEERKKWIIIGIGIGGFLITFIIFSLLLYVFPIYECSWCKYFNCFGALFDSDFCPDQNIKITRFDVL